MRDFKSNDQFHIKMPILEIWTNHQMIVDLFKNLEVNGFKITIFDKDLGEEKSIISIGNGEIYASIECKPEEDNLIIKFIENDSSIHPQLLLLILTFAQNNKLKVVTNRISKLLPENFPHPILHEKIHYP